MDDDSSKPFVIELPTRIRLSPLAREMAKMHGLVKSRWQDICSLRTSCAKRGKCRSKVRTDMVLRYSDKPSVSYGTAAPDAWRDRFPPHAKSINSAPLMGGTPITVYSPDGKAHRALHHLGCWREVAPVKDSYSGQTTMRMNGNLIRNPVLWSS